MLDEEIDEILNDCHALPVRGHDSDVRTTTNILQSGYNLPILYKYAHEFSGNTYNAKNKVRCQKGMSFLLSPFYNLSFNVLRIDFIGQFSGSFGN